MIADKYVDARNNLNSYLLDIYDEGILTKEDILIEVENVFGEEE
jgi:hypothetical protein